MRLLSVTVPQRQPKQQLAGYFYTELLGLPQQDVISKSHTRWFTHPMLLEAKAADPTELRQPKGGFTGIQLNLYPRGKLRGVLNALRGAGYKQSDPTKAGEARVISVQDPTGNIIMMVAHKERPDEPLVNHSIGSVTVFVSSLAKTRGFYENVLELPLRAAPHPGMLVFGEAEQTALMLYQVARGNPNTPIGRQTRYVFVSEDLSLDSERIAKSEGTIVERQMAPESEELMGIVFKDPERNTFEAFDRRFLALPEPLPVIEEEEPEPPEVMDRGAELELDDEPSFERDLELDGESFDRDLELD